MTSDDLQVYYTFIPEQADTHTQTHTHTHTHTHTLTFRCAVEAVYLGYIAGNLFTSISALTFHPQSCAACCSFSSSGANQRSITDHVKVENMQQAWCIQRSPCNCTHCGSFNNGSRCTNQTHSSSRHRFREFRGGECYLWPPRQPWWGHCSHQQSHPSPI